MAIPAWVIYMLKMAGAASGNKSMAGVGSVLGEVRQGQQSAEALDAAKSLAQKGGGGMQKLSAVENFINLADQGRGDLKIGGDGKITFTSDKRLLSAKSKEEGGETTAPSSSGVLGATSPTGGGGLDNTTKNRILQLFGE
jgi:hypothetical protein